MDSERAAGSRRPDLVAERSATIDSLRAGLDAATERDRARLAERIDALARSIRRGRGFAARAARIAQETERSAARLAHRRSLLPVAAAIPDELPIAVARARVEAAMREHPVVLVAGETGSGKSTQLPKICLGLGRGAAGLIGHTQPRRIAARGVAARIAAELGVELGTTVGYQVRFGGRVGPDCLVKVMTDGILLAEIQSDPELLTYDTLIIDEVHERSLNLDFLLGHLRGLVRRRPRLRVVLASATADTDRLADFYSGAPVVRVGGRGFPIEIRHHPDAGDDGADVPERVAAAVAELLDEARGDVLAFLAGEREIREAARHLRGKRARGAEVLALHARLPFAEQQRVFAPAAGRRVVLATNVAETAITVPGVRCVVDSGRARISRCRTRSAIRHLPIEPISQAAAEQRAGRCGRLGPGICVRLYSREDLASRPEHTEPEILRTDLASVLLRIRALGIRDAADFPFLDRPDRRRLNDAERLLGELGAVDAAGALTKLGRRLASLPVDPRIGRILIAGAASGCLDEVLVVAAAMSIPDPRERVDGPARGEIARLRGADSRSDFVSLLNLWRRFRARGDEGLGGFCRRRALSPVRMREWLDVHAQLRDLMRPRGRPSATPASYARIHRALLAGLLRNVGQRGEGGVYGGPRGIEFRIVRASDQHARRPRWVVCAELVETDGGIAWSQRVAEVRPEWIEDAAGDTLRRDYFDAYWDMRRGEPMVFERTALYGLTVVARRPVRYAPVDADGAREVFVRNALVEERMQSSSPVLTRNRALLSRLRGWEDRMRRPELVVSDRAVYEFYARRLPAEVRDARSFEAWAGGDTSRHAVELTMHEDDVLGAAVPAGLEADYPGSIEVGGHTLALGYVFAPGADDDGITVEIPRMLLADLDPGPFEWLVPGYLSEKVDALLRALPKAVRRELAPLGGLAAEFAATAGAPRGSLAARLAQWIHAQRGVAVPDSSWSTTRLARRLPAHLRMRFRVVDREGAEILCGRDLTALQRAAGARAEAARPADLARHRDWSFVTLAAAAPDGADGHLALVDRGDGVEVAAFPSADAAARAMQGGLERLLMLRLERMARRWAHCAEDLDALVLRYMMLPPPPLGDDGDGPDLLHDLLRAALAAEIPADPCTVRDHDDFAALLANCEGALAPALDALAAEGRALLERHQALRAASASEALAALPESRADVTEQLDHLVYRGFLAATDAARRRELPRYLDALALRLERIDLGGAGDGERLARIAPAWRRYLERARAHRARGIRDPELDRYRWLVEEFRVSVFAQQLGAAERVSPERLERQWRRVRR